MLSREYFKIIQLESRFNKSGLFVSVSQRPKLKDCIVQKSD